MKLTIEWAHFYNRRVKCVCENPPHCHQFYLYIFWQTHITENPARFDQFYLSCSEAPTSQETLPIVTSFICICFEKTYITEKPLHITSFICICSDRHTSRENTAHCHQFHLTNTHLPVKCTRQDLCGKLCCNTTLHNYIPEICTTLVKQKGSRKTIMGSAVIPYQYLENYNGISSYHISLPGEL